MEETPELTIRTEASQMDVDFIHQFLTNIYWARGRSREAVQACIINSFNIGLFLEGKQVAYARVVTDYVVFAYLLDVFVAEPYRGRGYSLIMLKNLLQHPRLTSIQIWRLGTDDAQGLYAKLGFTVAAHPEKLMVLLK
ncbi:GNAT family N-acetyltransferase [Rhodocytophaga aerolata]|uniref:GNAT family N-acetyltransferase n=1 Tax=Rhodocytophaga aerolata TaxID=455078 RepID=A0ABT8RAI8_9BACT|nr:GNAT family N-acetyltransferase [Rhodocytophaga aerolata]MDO1449120.1 GNAT family N-acetyltransferase [Rhodocytophaga aerolata]